mgnify:CR=1 FL=1
MKQLNEYETPETREKSYYSNDTQYGCGGYVVDVEDSQHLERKLEMCRDALADVIANYNGQMDCLDGTINDVKEALEQTKN